MLYTFSTDLIIFLPELFFIITILILLLWTLEFSSKYWTWNTKLTRNIVYLLIEIHFITFLLLLNNLHKTKIIFYESIISNNYTIFIKMIILICIIIFLIISLESVEQEFSERFEFLILIALTTFALLILISSNDIISFYLSIEMQSLCLYVLAAFKRTSQLSTEAGLKYFVLGALSSSFLLFGMSLIYGFTGSTNFIEISKSVLNSTNLESITNTFILGFILILCGFLFKLTAVPFHIWSPDVYEGAPLLVMIFFSTVPKLAIFCFFTKLIYTTFFDLYFIWQPILIITAALTILFSSIAALYQKKIKRFLAYSSINHVGYMLMSLATGTLLGVHSFFLYIFIYILTMFTFFSILISLKKETNKNIIYLTDLLYIKKIYPITRIILTLLFFSMAGIPPLIGFFAKFYVFLAAIETNYYLLLLISILCSTLSAFYYIRIIKIINFEKTLNINIIEFKPSLIVYIYCLLGVLLITLFFIVPNFLVTETYYLGLLLT
jgi:NADH-quinone oxidoreductase subunit N